MVDLIRKKRFGGTHSREELRFIINGMIAGDIPDYQVSSWLMAVCFQGMERDETNELVQAMIDSGDKVDLSSIPGIKVDKHSSGGVGDKTSLVLGPLVASCGVPVAKMSGRGLGHTGGTIDKLEAIQGFNVNVGPDAFLAQVRECGIAIAAQTGNLVPADKQLYALRDVTATVEQPSLIAGSIMSKKLASGADAIVLDVKCGSGAFMKDAEEARSLAAEMVRIGKDMGKPTVAYLTDMEQPLGNAVGNSLEVIEAIETLKGNGPDDLTELCLVLASEMLVLGGKAENVDAARNILQDMIQSGAAIAKCREWITAQGGDAAVVDDCSLFPQAKYQHEVRCSKAGYISHLDALMIGEAAMLLGAGRQTKESHIDLAAGLKLKKKCGDAVKEGTVLAVLYTNDESALTEAEEKVSGAYSVESESVTQRDLVLGRVE